MDFGSGPIGAVYFEPRQGIIRDTVWESNFYIYRLRQSCWGWCEEVVANAKLGSGGLEYAPGIYTELEAKEKDADRATKRLLSIAPERVDDIPRRQDGLLFEGDTGEYD